MIYTIQFNKSFKIDMQFMFFLGFYLVCCSVFMINVNYTHGIGLIVLFILYLRWIIAHKKVVDEASNISEFNPIYDYIFLLCSILGLALG